jgi:hypothetical protein
VFDKFRHDDNIVFRAQELKLGQVARVNLVSKLTQLANRNLGDLDAFDLPAPLRANANHCAIAASHIQQNSLGSMALQCPEE